MEALVACLHAPFTHAHARGNEDEDECSSVQPPRTATLDFRARATASSTFHATSCVNVIDDNRRSAR
jgi:hypothetical protein